MESAQVVTRVEVSPDPVYMDSFLVWVEARQSILEKLAYLNSATLVNWLAASTSDKTPAG